MQPCCTQQLNYAVLCLPEIHLTLTDKMLGPNGVRYRVSLFLGHWYLHFHFCLELASTGNLSQSFFEPVCMGVCVCVWGGGINHPDHTHSLATFNGRSSPTGECSSCLKTAFSKCVLTRAEEWFIHALVLARWEMVQPVLSEASCLVPPSHLFCYHKT